MSKISLISIVVAIFVLGIFTFLVNRKEVQRKEQKEFESSLTTIEEELTETEVSKPLIDPREIISGGPPKDGIPSIDKPKFIEIKEASKFLKDDDIGQVLNYKDEARFYPFQILVWHEIVNDAIKGEPILVTYCPLCFTGIVYERKIDGEAIEFGVSGKLWNNNLLMYDRKTDTLWSQILGKAVLGPLAGKELKIIPSDITKFSIFKKQFPKGKVLSRETGHFRLYGQDPYGDYYTSQEVIFPSKFTRELHPKEIILGIIFNGTEKAYPLKRVKELKDFDDEINGKLVNVTYDENKDSIKFLDKDSNKPINFIYSFWFSWNATYPNTQIFK